MGLHLDLDKIYLDNMRKPGTRKNNCLINTGDNQSKEDKKRKIEENLKKYGIEQEYIKLIKLPKARKDCVAKYFTVEEIDTDRFTTVEKLMFSEQLVAEIEKKLRGLEEEKLKET